MCGFAGGLLTASETHQRSILEKMGDTLNHRGPDDSGLHIQGPCGLVHRRLSVIDLSSSGHQPMSNENGTVWLVYNGEVYNFRELRAQYGLDGKGHQFRSSTDTEVLIHLYEELGEGFLNELNGMYSLALWDSVKGKLIVARDPFGVKPLFYTETPRGFWFGSEIKALLEVPGVQRIPSARALNGYLAFDYVPDNLTAFQDVHELLPGQVITVSPGNGIESRRQFFTYSYPEDDSISFEDACMDSLAILSRAVERTLISDVPVGVMLSGGMDSSAMTALMGRLRGTGDFHTFSLGFQEKSFDESPFAEIVAEAVGTRHHLIPVTPERVSKLLPKYLAHIDEPYADGSAIPTWLLAEKAAEHVTVLLSGEGGDEVYAGYDTHAALKARNLYRKAVPGFIRRGVIRPLVNSLPVSHRKLSFEFKAKRFAKGAELNIPHSHHYWRMVLSEEARRQVLSNPDTAGDLGMPVKLFEDIYENCSAHSDLNRILCIDTRTHLPHDLMIKNDRMTMAHSIEARVPFTDIELYRYLSKVPSKHKLPGMRKKAVLRRSLKGLLPDSILNKKKVGLEMPYSKWMRKELRDLSAEYLKPDRIKATGLLEPSAIIRLWEEHDQLRADHGRALWGILNYMMWYDLYIDSDRYRDHVQPGVSRL